MELRQLHYLIAVAREGSFTGAALACNVAQPALSRQIRKFEQELGLPLVDRTTRRTSLTPAGWVAVAAGQRVLAEIAGLQETLGRTKGLLQGTVAIGVTQTSGPIDVPKLLAEFSRRYPGVELILTEGLSIDLAHLLREDRLELAIVSELDRQAREQLEVRWVRSEKLVVVLPPNHALRKRKRLAIDDLREERFVSFPRGATIRRAVEHAAEAAGFRPNTDLETNSVGRMLALVAEGLGIAILPSTDAASSPGPPFLPLDVPTMFYGISLAWRARRELAPAARALRDLILVSSTAYAADDGRPDEGSTQVPAPSIGISGPVR